MDFIETCREFIAIDSSPGQGTREICELAAKLCQESGLDVELQSENYLGHEQANIIARPDLKGEEEMLLHTHLDTVDPGEYGLWSVTENNPFNATIFEDKIYGLGAADNKLDFVCKLQAIQNLKGKIKKPFVLAGTYGSDIAMRGVVRLLRNKKVMSKKALIGGPTNLKIFHTAKGTATVEIVLPFSEEEKKFRREHDLKESASSQSKMFMSEESSTVNRDKGNSNLKMLRYLTKLPDGIAILNLEGGISKNTLPSYSSLEFDVADHFEETIASKLKAVLRTLEQLERDFKGFADPAFNPPHPALNIGLIRTEEESIILLGTCHIPPSVTEEIYQEWMQRLRDTCGKVNGSFRVTEYIQPFRTPLGADILKSSIEELGQMGLDYTPSASGKSSAANIFDRFGIESVIFGAGFKSDRQQSHNESVPIEELKSSIQFYEKTLERLCT